VVVSGVSDVILGRSYFGESKTDKLASQGGRDGSVHTIKKAKYFINVNTTR
jgi:hypothetical protein